MYIVLLIRVVWKTKRRSNQEFAYGDIKQTSKADLKKIRDKRKHISLEQHREHHEKESIHSIVKVVAETSNRHRRQFLLLW